MNFVETQAKTLLRTSKMIDSWFISRFHMNLYRGCAHNCVYCDGRAEKYNVAGEFGRDVAVKTNALTLLQRELDPRHRRKPLPRGFICFGGGVGDAWQPAEERYRLTRGALEIAHVYERPVHALTKSTLIERDFDVLASINRRTKVFVSVSFSSIDPEICSVLEPGVPSPEQRLSLLSRAKKRGFPAGMFLMPVIPFVSDTGKAIDDAVRQAAHLKLDYVIFGGMTLKPGKQADHFLKIAGCRWPEVREDWLNLYAGTGQYGEPPESYSRIIHERFLAACRKYKIPLRIPAALFKDQVADDDYVLCLLHHIDYMLKIRGRRSGLGYGAYRLSQAGRPLADVLQEPKPPAGVNGFTVRIASEIINTGSAGIYEDLTRFRDNSDNKKDE